MESSEVCKIRCDNAYKAGAQSKQAEIDELQKRIDLALNELEKIHSFRTENSDNAINILKGTTNEQ